MVCIQSYNRGAPERKGLLSCHKVFGLSGDWHLSAHPEPVEGNEQTSERRPLIWFDPDRSGRQAHHERGEFLNSNDSKILLCATQALTK
jgi:hypothetical protein